ncbi:hypothetical protein PV08_07057 [Exophiala spinifera]|uniref:Uncharacterized protein n=1 Tax=Exophiala spinifera TaxID=91928 RepID=A0A0D2B6F3_9EURO|nr:uncharacterized protein PV08_07057 [Exophiala spinifera]KIW14275.1 hypothetical protein PV08_07057 [Exophiala spinifera]
MPTDPSRPSSGANNTTATITLSSSMGAPSHLASGFIYGIPDTPDQIPPKFYTGMGFRYNRAGGAQTPSKGWLAGVSEYHPRFQSALSNYRTAQQYGARFQLLLHDMWGADGGEHANASFPGDDGDWSSFDAFLAQVASDLNANGVREGLDIDIWNEPDISVFWYRPMQQWIDLWGRAYHTLRQSLGTDVPLVGPSLAYQPQTNNTWWTNFLSFVAQNSSIPDQWTWHVEGQAWNSVDDPEQSSANLKDMLATYGLPEHQFNINEYATRPEQQPAGAAWFISRLERNNIVGLRGNWASAGELHDYLANLLGKPGANTTAYSINGTGYWPNGEWQVYRYYATNMTGERVATTGAGDRKFDCYATMDGNGAVKILCGTRLVGDTYSVTAEGLAAAGLPDSGTVNICTYRFDFDGSAYADVQGPVALGSSSHSYSGGAVTWQVTPATNETAYAFEFC